MEKSQVNKASEAGRTLSKLGASKGGKARAAALTAEERRAIAREAIATRWARAKPHDEQSQSLKATHGSPDRPLRIGGIEIPCYVLADGRRVLIQNGMLTGLDMSQGTAGRGEGDRLAKFISGKAINPFINKDLYEMIKNPIQFKTPTGSTAYGYEATILADICDAVLEARKSTKLNHQSEHIAARCEILVRGFARVGIIALVDEATGYQEERDREALHTILEGYVSKELLPWAKRFPDEFYKQIFRLRGWTYSPLNPRKGPRFVAQITNKTVYEQLPPGVLDELRRKNPVVYNHGRRKNRLHEFLTNDIGNPHLEKQVAIVTAFMRASPNWKVFEVLFDRSFPSSNKQIEMDLDNHEAGEIWKDIEEPIE